MQTAAHLNKAVTILNKMQDGRAALIKKDGSEMLIAIVLDKPLAAAQAQTLAPGHYANGPSRCKGRFATFRVCNRLIRQPRQPHGNDTPPRAAANQISISTRTPRWETHDWQYSCRPRLQRHIYELIKVELTNMGDP